MIDRLASASILQGRMDMLWQQVKNVISRYTPPYKWREPAPPPAKFTIKGGRPPPPRELMANRVICERPLLGRRVNRETDNPVAALYRIYEHITLDQHIEIRNELEMFWYHNSWAVRDIPDPKDPDPERYACLACIPKILCLAFNKRIGLGLPRDAPPIFTADMMDEWKKKEPVFEEEPEWVLAVPCLREVLAIPHWDNSQRDFVPLDGFEDKRASAEFATKNILIWRLHIHFL